jgi:hypothetical protein
MSPPPISPILHAIAIIAARKMDAATTARITAADGTVLTGQKLVEGLRGRGNLRMTTDEVIALMRGPTADEA